MQWHLKQGHHLIVVSASNHLCLRNWCEEKGVELLTNTLEVINDRFTGHYTKKDCNYEEKVSRIKEVVNLQEFSEIYAYGDTEGDKAMLGIASHKFYRRFY